MRIYELVKEEDSFLKEGERNLEKFDWDSPEVKDAVAESHLRQDKADTMKYSYKWWEEL